MTGMIYNENATLVCSLNSGDKALITGEEIVNDFATLYRNRIAGIVTSSSWDDDESISGKFVIINNDTAVFQNWFHRHLKINRKFCYMKGSFVVEIPYEDDMLIDSAYKYGRTEFAKMIMTQKLKNAKLMDTTISTEVNFFTGN